MHYMDINIKKPCKTIASPAELFSFSHIRYNKDSSCSTDDPAGRNTDFQVAFYCSSLLSKSL